MQETNLINDKDYLVSIFNNQKIKVLENKKVEIDNFQNIKM